MITTIQVMSWSSSREQSQALLLLPEDIGTAEAVGFDAGLEGTRRDATLREHSSSETSDQPFTSRSYFFRWFQGLDVYES
jgi:hypothetical protein